MTDNTHKIFVYGNMKSFFEVPNEYGLGKESLVGEYKTYPNYDFICSGRSVAMVNESPGFSIIGEVHELPEAMIEKLFEEYQNEGVRYAKAKIPVMGLDVPVYGMLLVERFEDYTKESSGIYVKDNTKEWIGVHFG